MCVVYHRQRGPVWAAQRFQPLHWLPFCASLRSLPVSSGNVAGSRERGAPLGAARRLLRHIKSAAAAGDDTDASTNQDGEPGTSQRAVTSPKLGRKTAGGTPARLAAAAKPASARKRSAADAFGAARGSPACSQGPLSAVVAETEAVGESKGRWGYQIAEDGKRVRR